MSIVVFWLAPNQEALSTTEPTLAPVVRQFDSRSLAEALAFCESLRKSGMRHVTISSEPDDSVTLPGVSDILPEGYDWKKRRD